jgi:plasmid maintenance system antidote protein VapI
MEQIISPAMIIIIHPGEHLAEELNELEMSAAALARRLDVPTRIERDGR